MRCKLLLLSIVLTTLLGCQYIGRSRLNKKKLEGSNEFKDILTLKYLRYSEILKTYSDYKSSRYFLQLANDAYNSYNRISFKFDDYMLTEDPSMLADIYFLFNCWYYFESNNKNLGEASICKDSFNKLIAIVEQKRNKNSKTNITVEDGRGTSFLTADEEIYYSLVSKTNKMDIYFDFDSYKLNNGAVQKVSALLKYIKNLKQEYKILVIGHTDRAGKVIYNNTLARRRANTVRNILNKNGVPKDLLTIEVVASQHPEIITRQGEKFQSNRRVEVIIDTNVMTQDMLPQPFF